MTIYFVAGEVSADNHGAALMRSLRQLDPNVTFIGRGGPQMQQVAGAQFKNWIGDSAVLGLWEVLRKYGYFRQQFRQTLSEIQESKPDAVVLIDYPGFNLRLARALRKQPQKPQTIYYISPQVWAWNRGRIKTMARLVDLMLCIFPFEADLYTTSGLRAVFVGHPMIERLERQKIESRRDPNLIGLFPGSRSREVRKILPVMLETARLLLQAKPGLRFQIAAASEQLAREMRHMLTPHLNPLPSLKGEAEMQAPGEPSEKGLSSSTGKDKTQVSPNESSFGTPLPSRGEGMVRGEASHAGPIFEIRVGDTADIMQRAFVGIVASGSATLEAAFFRMPFMLIYKVAWPTYVAARLVVKVDYLGMPNLLAGRQVVPEFIQHETKPETMANGVRLLMEDAKMRDRMISDFDAVITKLGGSGASDRAAQAIFQEVAGAA